MRPAERVLAVLAGSGLLLKQDKTLPSVVGILTGESLRGSWWSHPRAHLVYAVLSELAEHPDVLFTKLLYRKDTLVHRSLWPAVRTVGGAREPWQMRRLSPAARRLLERLDRSESPIRAAGAPAKELSERLLAAAREVHTETGRHAIALESWRAWSARSGCDALSSVPLARDALEGAAVRLGAPLRALPWPAK